MSELPDDIAEAVASLAAESGAIRRFFENRVAGKDVRETQLEQLDGFSRREAIDFAKKLEDVRCADFIIGRRGKSTRIRWRYGLKNTSTAALGRAVSDPRIQTTMQDQETNAKDLKPMTIAQAKEALSKGLGVPVDKIEIIIRA